jgi:hypothetical protein
MLLRAMHVLPISAATVQLYGEVQRTNMVVHVEAAVCDGDLLVRTAGQHGFGPTEQNRLLLKVAFLDLPLQRVFGAERLANQELSRMLQDLATEREAAGRPIWRDTDRMLGRAPVPGSAGCSAVGARRRRRRPPPPQVACWRSTTAGPVPRETAIRGRAEVRTLLQEPPMIFEPHIHMHSR